MSNNVVSIEEAMPHLVIDGLGGGQHVIPVQFFKNISTGTISLKELDAFESVVPTIINEWLCSKGLKSG